MADFPPVIILSGGLGTRMSSLYPDLPKALIPINNEPFIAHQLRLLARQSVREVTICVGHLYEQLEDYVGSGKSFDIKVSYSYDGEEPLGTGGAVLKAITNISGHFAVLYGDSYLETPFIPIKKVFSQQKKLGLLTVYKNNNLWDRSNLSVQSGLVAAYNKSNPTADMKFIDYGLSIFDRKAFADFSEKKSFDLGELFSALIQKKQLVAYEVRERFYEVGSPSGLNELKEYLSSSTNSYPTANRIQKI